MHLEDQTVRRHVRIHPGQRKTFLKEELPAAIPIQNDLATRPLIFITATWPLT